MRFPCNLKAAGLSFHVNHPLLSSGDSITDLKFNPDDLFLESKDQDLQLEVSFLKHRKCCPFR